MNNKAIVIKNKQKIFQLQLQLSTFENLQLQLQQNSVINYNFVNYNYDFSKPDLDPDFDWSSTRLSGFLCRNLGNLKKKVFTEIETVFLSKFR